MGSTTHDGRDDDATMAWVASASRAELGDLMSSAHDLSSASVTVGAEALGRIVRVGGDLASGSAAYLDVVLEQEARAAPRAMIVDLSEAAFVGVRGIAALVRAAARAAESGTALLVVTPLPPDFVRHLRTLGLAGLFDLHGSVAECRSALVDRALREPAVRSRAREEQPARVGAPGVRGPDGLQIVVEPVGDVVVVRLSGPLSLRTAAAVSTALAKPLLHNGSVVADLAAVRLEWLPALQVFPSTLAAIGGWPTARLVLLDPGRELATAISGLRIDRLVPVVRGLPAALAVIDRPPSTVLRYHELARDPGAPRRARGLLRAACADWQVDALAPDASIVVNSLVTNALQHARTSCRLILRLDDTALHVSVRDREVADEATLQRLRSAPASGGGLHVVGAFARAQGVTPHSDGKTVWASIDRRRRP